MKRSRGTSSPSLGRILQKKTNVNEAWNAFKEPFLNVLKKHARIMERNVHGRDLPWLNNELKKAIHKRDYYC